MTWLRMRVTGDGADTVIDSDGEGALVRNGVKLALGVRAGPGADSWSFTGSAGGTVTFRKLGAGYIADLEITFGDGSGDRITVKDFDFVRAQTVGVLGIRLLDAPSAPQTTRTIVGDFEPRDTRPEEPGLQPQFDELGNLVLTVLPAPGRSDELADGAGNDRIEPGAGDDVVRALRGSDDWIAAAEGRDLVQAGEGADWVEGGAEADMVGESSEDVLFAEESGLSRLTFHSAAADTAPSFSGRGDLLSGEAGEDLLVGSGFGDLLFGGAGRDLIVGGGGADNLLGDASLLGATV